MAAVTAKLFRAWLAGVGVLALANLVWLSLLELDVYSSGMAVILWISPGIAAITTSYLAPFHKFALGASMALPAALFAVMLNATSQLAGKGADFSGLKGGLILFTLVLIGSAVLSSLAAVATQFLTRHRG